MSSHSEREEVEAIKVKIVCEIEVLQKTYTDYIGMKKVSQLESMKMIILKL